MLERSPVWLSAILVLAPAGSRPAFAQHPAEPAPTPEAPEAEIETESELETPAVTVTATRLEADPFDVPHQVTVIDGDDIRSRRSSRTPNEALSETMSVSAQQTGRGQGSPFLRGLTGFHTLLLVDGVRLNNSVFRFGANQYFNTIDPSIIDRIEIVGGPASVLYGSDALGGVIQVITRRPDFDEGDHEHARAFLRYASADTSLGERIELEAVRGDFGVLGGFSYKDFQELSGGQHTGQTRETAFDESDADVKLSYRIADEAFLTVLFQQTLVRNAPRTHSTIFSQSYRGTAVGGDLRRDFDQTRRLAAVQLAADELRGPVDAVRLSLAWHSQIEEQKRHRTGGRFERQGFDVESFQASLLLASETPIGLLSYGADFAYDDVETERRDGNATTGSFTILPRGPVADDAQYSLAGFFAQDEIDLFRELVTVTAGVRYALAYLDADDVDPDPADAFPFAGFDETYEEVVASGRVLVRLHPFVHLAGGIARGFRAPNLDDTTAFQEVRSNTFDSPSPGLDPETTITYEVGVKTEHDRFRGSAFVHFTEFHDAIVRVPTGRVVGGSAEFAKENASDAEIFGVDVEGEVALLPEWQLSIYGGFSYVRGDAVQLDPATGLRRRQPFDRIPPPRGIVGVRYRDPEGRFWVEAYAIIAKHQHRLSPGDVADIQRIPPGGTPGYSVYGLRGGVAFRPWVRATLSIENLSDHDYRIHGSGQNEPGTNAVVALELQY